MTGASAGAVTCTLSAEPGDFDQATVTTSTGEELVALEHTAALNTPKAVSQRCAHATASMRTRMEMARITAIRVQGPNHLPNSPLG